MNSNALLRVQSLIFRESQQVVRLYEELQAVQADLLYQRLRKVVGERDVLHPQIGIIKQVAGRIGIPVVGHCPQSGHVRIAVLRCPAFQDLGGPGTSGIAPIAPQHRNVTIHNIPAYAVCEDGRQLKTLVCESRIKTAVNLRQR